MTVPNTLVRTVQTNVGLMVADSGPRRSLGSFANAYQTLDGRLNTTSITLAPGQIFTPPPAASAYSVTYISCSAPLLADIDYDSVTIGSFTRPAETRRHIVNRQLLTDDAVKQIVVQNPSATVAVRLLIVLG